MTNKKVVINKIYRNVFIIFIKLNTLNRCCQSPIKVNILRPSLSFNLSKAENYTVATAWVINIRIYLKILFEILCNKICENSKFTSKIFNISGLFLILFKTLLKYSVAIKQLFVMHFQNTVFRKNEVKEWRVKIIN